MTITLTEEQAQQLCKGESITISPKPKQWEPKGGEYCITTNGKVIKEASLPEFRKFGTERQTQEEAEDARDAMRVHNRLLAWVAENDKGWVADWEDATQTKYYIFHSYSPEKYGYYSTSQIKDLGTVYMSKSAAERLVKLLNEGVVVL